jgi:uncharacterized protein YegP (UPF0339 family)
METLTKPYYTVFKGKDGQFYFNLKAENHKIILQSEGYTTKQNAINGLESVQNNCQDDGNFVRKTAVDGSPYFVLRAKNNEPIGKSEMYSSVPAMENGIRSVKENGITTIYRDVSSNVFKISINNTDYKTQEEYLIGWDILRIANFNSGRFCLFLVCNGKRELIGSSQVVKMENGHAFQVTRND